MPAAYAVESTKALPDAGGGLPAYVAHDRQAANANRVALMLSRNASPRLGALEALIDPIDNLMAPLAHGIAPSPGRQGRGVLHHLHSAARANRCRRRCGHGRKGRCSTMCCGRWRQGAGDAAKPGPDPSLDPAEQCLCQAASGQPVTIGAAWAAPPGDASAGVVRDHRIRRCATRQAEDDGTIADDVYALGVLLLVTVGWQVCPLAGRTMPSIIRAKLESGSLLPR